MRLGDKRPKKNFGQPIGVVREGGGRVQPHTFLDSKRNTRLRIRVQESRTFWNNEGTRIAWNPITLLCTPKAEDLLKMQEILENEEQKELLA